MLSKIVCRCIVVYMAAELIVSGKTLKYEVDASGDSH